MRSSSAKELRTAAQAPQPAGSAEKGASPSGATHMQKQARKLREPGAVDVLQFLKYFHLVPAQVRSFTLRTSCWLASHRVLTA